MAHPSAAPAALTTDFTSVDATPQFELGTIGYGTQGRRYRYVKLVDIGTAAPALNKCSYIASATTWDVSLDVSGGSAITGLKPVGILVSVPDADHPYCWVQFAGIASFVAGSASIVAGDWLMPDTSEDGDLTEATAGTDENLVGYAVATVADDATGVIHLTIRET